MRICKLVLIWDDNTDSLRVEVRKRVEEAERRGSIDMQTAQLSTGGFYGITAGVDLESHL